MVIGQSGRSRAALKTTFAGQANKIPSEPASTDPVLERSKKPLAPGAGPRLPASKAPSHDQQSCTLYSRPMCSKPLVSGRNK